MEAQPKRCRRCLLQDMADENDYYASVVRYRATMPRRVRTPDAEYTARLEHCRTCPALTPGPACSAAAMWKCVPPAQTCTARWITRPGNKPLYHFSPHRQPARCGIFCLQRQYFALLLQYYAPFPLVSPIFICYNNNLLSNLGF